MRSSHEAIFRHAVRDLTILSVLTGGLSLMGCASNPDPILVKPPPDGPVVLIIGEVDAVGADAKRRVVL